MSDYPDPIITGTAIIFNLVKPIFSDYYGIWDKWLKIAKRRDLNIVLKTQFGVSTYTYGSYMKGAVRGKHPHFYPNDPMIFYHRHVLKDISERAKRKKIEKKIEMSSNSVMESLARLKRKEPQMFAEVRRKLGLR